MFSIPSFSPRRFFAGLALTAALAVPVVAQLPPCCWPCFDACHAEAMAEYERTNGNYDAASEVFFQCLDEC